MTSTCSRNRLVVVDLTMGVAVPFFYFGTQIFAAFFYPGYSPLNRDASTLGSAGSRFPAIFNGGSIIVGILACVASLGFWAAFQQIGTNRTVGWLTLLATVAFGLGSINAGLFPLPDPRHTQGPLAILGLASVLLPFLIPMALWRLHDARPLKIYFVSNIIVLIALLPVMSGLIQIILVKTGTESPAYQSFLNHYHGALQRVFALIAIGPLGAGAYALAKRATNSPSPTDLLERA